MIPLFADRLADLKKLKLLGEWEVPFNKYEHICSDCLKTLAAKS